MYKQPFLYSSVTDGDVGSLAVLSRAVRMYDVQIPSILKPLLNVQGDVVLLPQGRAPELCSLEEH